MYKIFIIILLIITDLLTKKIIYDSIDLNTFISILPFFDLAHIHNYGISFGLFANQIKPWIIVLISSLVTIVIIVMAINSKSVIEKWGLILIVAGAISNTIDRAMNNYVLDFIYMHYKEFYWPAFNFADIYITIGFLTIFYQIIINIKKNDVT